MPTFTFQDIFKSSFLERLDAVSLPDAAIALAPPSPSSQPC